MKKHQPSRLFPQCMAAVNHEDAARILQYDHHRVRVDGKLSVMLTYDWLQSHETTQPLTLIVVFPPASVALAHPAAPEDVQALIDQLVFR